MLFSVLIANYNNGKYLKEAVNSVLQQSHQEFEIIIVDDGSNDCSQTVYNDLNKFNDSRIQIFFNKKNSGCGYTKMRCAQLANGKIMGYLDPDDTLTTNALEFMVNKHKLNPNTSIVYSTHTICDEEMKPLYISKSAKAIPKGETHLTVRSISAFASFKSAHYKQTKGISPKYKRAVDQDLYLKLEEVGDVVFFPISLYNYRQHSSGISLNSNTWKAHIWHALAKYEAFKRRKNEHVNLREFISEEMLGKAEICKNHRLIKHTILFLFYSFSVNKSVMFTARFNRCLLFCLAYSPLVFRNELKSL